MLTENCRKNLMQTSDQQTDGKFSQQGAPTWAGLPTLDMDRNEFLELESRVICTHYLFRQQFRHTANSCTRHAHSYRWSCLPAPIPERPF